MCCSSRPPSAPSAPSARGDCAPPLACVAALPAPVAVARGQPVPVADNACLAACQSRSVPASALAAARQCSAADAGAPTCLTPRPKTQARKRKTKGRARLPARNTGPSDRRCRSPCCAAPAIRVLANREAAPGAAPEHAPGGLVGALSGDRCLCVRRERCAEAHRAPKLARVRQCPREGADTAVNTTVGAASTTLH